MKNMTIKELNLAVNIVNLLSVEIDNNPDWHRYWDTDAEKALKNAVLTALRAEYGDGVDVVTTSGACRTVAIPTNCPFPFVVKVDTPRGFAGSYGGCADEVSVYEHATEGERYYLAEAFGYEVTTDGGTVVFVEFQEKLDGDWEVYRGDREYIVDADDWEAGYGGLHTLCDRLEDLHTGNFLVHGVYGTLKIIDYACKA